MGAELHTRALDYAQVNAASPFTLQQNQVLYILAVTSAALSLAGAFLTLRWFLLMKRSFRHHLILLLILSDTFKALWYLIYPVVGLTRGEDGSSKAFCLATGFLLSTGIEASDFAILIIAIHSALYIFRPPQEFGAGGLYPFRYWIYPLWIALPILAASLAFINADSAYVDAGAICYLPRRPIWYRLGLAWVPRYIVFIFILAAYAGIYTYVHIKFKNFKHVADDDEDTYGTDETEISADSRRNSFAADIGMSGLMAVAFVEPSRRRQMSESRPMPPGRRPSAIPKRVEDVAQNVSSANRHQHLSSVAQSRQQSRFSSLAETTSRHDQTSMSPHAHPHHDGSLAHSHHSSRPTKGESAALHDLVTEDLRSKRRTIRRQLRFLFIYPVVYILMWIIPFIQHCMSYSNHYTLHPVFGLNLCSTIILALQAGVDALIFSWREKPWRRIESDHYKWWVTYTGVVEHLNGTRKKDGNDPEASQRSSSATLAVTEPRVVTSRGSGLWWEAEGKKRKDSIWMGTDQINEMARFRSQESKASNQVSSSTDDTDELEKPESSERTRTLRKSISDRLRSRSQSRNKSRSRSRSTNREAKTSPRKDRRNVPSILQAQSANGRRSLDFITSVPLGS